MSASKTAGRMVKAVVGLLVALLAMTPAADARAGTAVITGGNTGITAGWRASAAGSEFLARCLATQATGNSSQDAALPASNGQGAYVIDLGAPKTGFVYTEATIPVKDVGPSIPTPGVPPGSFQLHNFDLDLYFVSAQCTEVGKAVTQDSNEVGLISTPARYVVILLAFNATGGPAVTVNWGAP
jgi:hypothetical protein